MTTSVANQVQSAPLAGGESKAVVIKGPWWDRPALFRYGFVALILIVWEIVGPFINPIFFTYPTKIAAAFYTTTVPANCHTTSRKVWRLWPMA